MHAPFPAVDLEQRWKAVRVHIAKGDQAKAKAEQHHIAAGQHLAALKAEHSGTWAEWEALVKEKAGIGKSRASELMQIADGRTTVEKVRADAARRVMKHAKSSPLANGESRALAKPDMPTEAEAEERYQETLLDQACLFLKSMTDETRQRFFAYVNLAEQPENNDLAILRNPITRAWCKATNKQRREFALEYEELIAGFAEEERRRLPHAEPRRLQRPADDLDETKIDTDSAPSAENSPPIDNYPDLPHCLDRNKVPA
jgi:hypothetical protein